MATKQDGCPCYDKAAPDEPIFVLRAQDLCAADTVRAWVRKATVAGVDPKKLLEAETCALAMEKWPTRKVPD